MFKNNLINGCIHETRFIASWLKVGGKLNTWKDHDDFRDWLSSLGLPEDKVYHISNLAMTGKLELEISAKSYLVSVAQ